MPIETVAPNIYRIPLGMVNAYLIDEDGCLTLIDTGMPGSAPAIIDALKQLGKQTCDLRHILISHLHVDHAGSAHALKTASGAKVYMHPADAEMIRQGGTMRPARPGPGLVNQLAVNVVMKRMPSAQVKPVEVNVELADGQTLDFAGGLTVLHTPGHTAGHLAFLHPAVGGVLFCGDACRSMPGLDYSFLYEDFEQGRCSLRRLARLPFETAVFSHGRPLRGAAAVFWRKWN